MTEPWQPTKTGYMQCDNCHKVSAPLHVVRMKVVDRIKEVCSECRTLLLSTGQWKDDGNAWGDDN